MLNQLSFWRAKRLPVYLQIEGAECGLACLSMISAYWGHRVDMASMRRRFSISMKGLTLKSIMSMAQSMALQSRALKLEIENLRELNLPCILHWDLNHFVVLKSISSTHAVLHDPAVGERRLLITELAKHFTGIALELGPAADFKKVDEVQKISLRSLMGRVIGLKQGLVKLILLGLALQICTLIAPFYMQWLVDDALLSSDRDLVTVLGIGFLLLVVLQTFIKAVRSWITTALSTNLNFRWFGNAFEHLMKLPLTYFEKRHTGDIVSRFGSIQTMQRTLTTQFVEGVIDGVLMIGTLIMMFLYSIKLAIIACLVVCIYFMLRLTSFRATREASAEQIIHAAKQQSHMMESVRGVQSVRLFGRNEERRSGWMNTLSDQFNADLRVAKLTLSYQTARNLLFDCERVIVIWIAALAVLSGELSVGMLFAFIAYKDQFSERCSGLVDKVFEFRMLKVHGERLADIVMTPVEQEFYNETAEAENIVPTIEFRDVSFRYSDSEPDVLKNLNLTVPAGQFLAVAGPSGGGKTTLLKLMLGLLEPTSGEILIGGVPLDTFGMSNYRALVGTVMQGDSLFSGSIQDNISFFDQNPDFVRIIKSSVLSSIHAEIAAMPMTYNTLVGEIGSGISGGQQQRILLARALYKSPQILVLDEATSHLDLRNEQSVNAAIKKIAMTRIIVAHRPDTIAMAERVVHLSGGEIISDVTNCDLLGNAVDTKQGHDIALPSPDQSMSPLE